MKTAINDKPIPSPVMECWNKVKDWDYATKFEFGLMIFNSLKQSYPMTEQDDDAKFIEEYENNLRPYTMDEINAMLDDAEADFAAGKGISAEDVDREMEEELQCEEAEEARNLFYNKTINKPLYAVV